MKTDRAAEWSRKLILRLTPTKAPLPKSFLAAQLHRAKGDAEQARIAYEQALPAAERVLERELGPEETTNG